MNKDKGKERISLILSLFSYEKKGILENSNFNGKVLKLIAFYRIGIFVISYVRISKEALHFHAQKTFVSIQFT